MILLNAFLTRNVDVGAILGIVLASLIFSFVVVWALLQQNKRKSGGLTSHSSPNENESSSPLENINPSQTPHSGDGSNANPNSNLVREAAVDRPEPESIFLNNEIETPSHNEDVTSTETDAIEIPVDKLVIAVPCAPPHNQGFSRRWHDKETNNL